MTDTPTEEIVEEMERIESELASRYEHHREKAEQDTEDTEQDEGETDGQTDSRINEHVARVDRYTTHQVDGEECLVLSLQTEDGLEFKYIPLPDDPTDQTEPLVRLCAYLDVPIDQLSEIRGEYIPLCKDVRGETVIHIPPIPTTGNLLRYRIERFLREKEILVWYDAVEAAREKYAERKVKRADASLGSEEHHSAQMEAYEEIGEEDVDQYPCQLKPGVKIGVILLGMLATSSIWIVSDPPILVDVISKVMTGLLVFMVACILGGVAIRGLSHLRDRLFPKVS